MASFKKKRYTDPVIGNHCNDLKKDWYVFFRFKHEGKEYKFKRREGVNRINDLNERLSAIEKLKQEISDDLKYGWNPTIDPKRELIYVPIKYNHKPQKKAKRSTHYGWVSKKELRRIIQSKGLS